MECLHPNLMGMQHDSHGQPRSFYCPDCKHTFVKARNKKPPTPKAAARRITRTCRDCDQEDFKRMAHRDGFTYHPLCYEIRYGVTAGTAAATGARVRAVVATHEHHYRTPEGDMEIRFCGDANCADPTARHDPTEVNRPSKQEVKRQHDRSMYTRRASPHTSLKPEN